MKNAFETLESAFRKLKKLFKISHRTDERMIAANINLKTLWKTTLYCAETA